LEKVGARRFRNGCYEIASARVTTLTSDGRSQTKTPKRLGLPAEHEKSALLTFEWVREERLVA
jgi:hypothetical protein